MRIMIIILLFIFSFCFVFCHIAGRWISIWWGAAAIDLFLFIHGFYYANEYFWWCRLHQASHRQQHNHSSNNSSSNRMPWPTWLWQCQCHRSLGMSGMPSSLAGTRCRHAGAQAKVSSVKMESSNSSRTTHFVDSRSLSFEKHPTFFFSIVWEPWLVGDIQ